MTYNLQGLVTGKIAIGLAALLARVLPPRLGYAAADFIADRIAALRTLPTVRAIRANQWVARGESLAGGDLDRAVRETLRNSARSIFDLYRFLQNPRAARRSIEMDPAARRLIRRPEFGERGLVVVSLHLGNFDLILHALSMEGVRPLILTIPDPQGGRRLEFDSRRKAGANILPMSFASLRQAVHHLEQGGFVATGIDRPVPDPQVRPLFFGRPAALPVHHIFLALKAKVPLTVLATVRRPDGKHYIHSSGLVEMDPHPDRETETLRNAEKVLRAAEGFIRRAPGQWSVSLPVWPEALELAPA
ncbi:MAG: lysophospholipid acyltransferase family protein [Anaerolineales bacterium]|nr:lysophospholipid acyltransferase family protein [Anaerolineales bacterium]